MFQLWPLATSKPVSSSTLKSILCSTRSGIQARNKDAGIESQKTEAKLAEMKKSENLKLLLFLGILVMRLMTKVCSVFILTTFTFNDNE